MENIQVRGPKDDQIINKDDSVTNKDGDNYLEKGEQPTDQKKEDDPRVRTVTPDNENGDPGPSADSVASITKKNPKRQIAN